MRGYEIDDLPNNSVYDPSIAGSVDIATPIFSKYTIELRYPLSLNPSSTIFVLAFAQGGNAWRTSRDFNPFDLKRSVGPRRPRLSTHVRYPRLRLGLRL